ncbi:MAG: translation initiation factor IF-3 [Rickettsiales bacterium]|nr:translation initiation factor IF-3 [Rickettsiales bacterium]
MANNTSSTLNVNERIRAREVRLIGADGGNLGVVDTRDAIKRARESGLDLIEISPSANPPVARIADWGKWKYDEAKKLKESKSSQKIQETKELKMRPNIDVHDLGVKMKAARKFIEAGDKVKFTVRFRGREIANQDAGVALLGRIRDELGDAVKVDRAPLMEGRQMAMLVSPAK